MFLFVIIALLYYSVHSMPNIVNSYAQNNTGPQTTTIPARTTTEDINTRSRYYNSQQDPILSIFGMISGVTNVEGDS